MNIRLALSILLTLALTVPVAASTASPTSDAGNGAVIAKKKKKAGTWCATQAKKQPRKEGTYKRAAKSNSQKAFLYLNKKRSIYLFCSESPKATGGLNMGDKVEIASNFQAVRKQCASFYSQTAANPADEYSGRKAVMGISYFRSGGKTKAWFDSAQLGKRDEVVELHALKLSKNCFWAAGYMVNGKPMIGYAGTGSNRTKGFLAKAAPGATAADLKTVNVKVISKTQAQITWTQAGQLKTIDR